MYCSGHLSLRPGRPEVTTTSQRAADAAHHSRFGQLDRRGSLLTLTAGSSEVALSTTLVSENRWTSSGCGHVGDQAGIRENMRRRGGAESVEKNAVRILSPSLRAQRPGSIGVRAEFRPSRWLRDADCSAPMVSSCGIVNSGLALVDAAARIERGGLTHRRIAFPSVLPGYAHRASR